MDEKLPVTIYVSRLSVGGAENMMVRLANQFLADGHRVTMIVSERGGALEERLSQGIELLFLDARRSWTATVRLTRLLRRRAPPVVLSALTYPNISAVIASRLAGRRTRVVISERSSTSHWLRNRGARRARLETPLVRAAYRRADGIIAVSEGVADDLHRLLGPGAPPVAVVHNPTVDGDTERMAREALQHPLFDDADTAVIVGAGRLIRQKDFATLIRAFALLDRRPDLRLLILGEGQERADLEALVAELGLSGKVVMPGRVANPLAFFRYARLFVLSSRFEGFPNVLVEALLTGVPVVSTDCPSGPREILDGGRIGRLVPVGDPHALADAMEAALADPGEAAARTQHARSFSSSAAAGKYLSILEGAMR